MPRPNEGSVDERFEWALSLLTHPCFLYIRKRAEDYPLTKAEASLLPLPPGIAFEQVWELLTTLRRQTAVELNTFGFKSVSGGGWYTLTRSMRTDLADIDRRCHKGSSLDSMVHSKPIMHFLQEAHINGALSAVREDGVFLSKSRANQVLLGRRSPRNGGERLLLNCHQMIRRLEGFAELQCAPQLMMEIYESIAEGVQSPTTPPAVFEFGGFNPPVANNTQILDIASRLINGDGVDAFDHPVFIAMAVMYLLLNGCPFPSCNGVMASVLSWLLFLKAELPVVALIPILRIHRAWQRGDLCPPMAMTSLQDSLVTVDGEIDWTLDHATMAHLVRLELDATERALRTAINRDEALSQTLLSMSSINHRQRAVLNAALDDPEVTFTVSAHQKTHMVAYSTAWDDLHQLSELGFLDELRSNRAFIFRPVHDLRTRLRDHARLEARSLHGGESQ